MSRDKLYNAVADLCAAKRTNPSYIDIMNVAPHLDRNEAAKLMQTARVTGFVEFIGPPLYIRGAEHVYMLMNDPATDMLELWWDGCYRRKESYAFSQPPHNWVAGEMDYRERVADYAEAVFGDYLQWDKAIEIIKFALLGIDIVDPVTNGPPVLGVCTAGFSRKLDHMEMAANSTDYPIPQVLESHMTKLITGPRCFQEELAVNRAFRVARNCAHCGGGIDLVECQFCGKRPLNPGALVGGSWPYPMPRRVYTDAGFTPIFKLHPINALKAYYIQWGLKDLKMDDHRKPETRTRVINMQEDI